MTDIRQIFSDMNLTERNRLHAVILEQFLQLSDTNSFELQGEIYAVFIS